jgi:spore germination protein GerM
MGENTKRRWSRLAAFVFGLLVMLGIGLLINLIMSPVLGQKNVQLFFASFGYRSLYPVDRDIDREAWHQDPLKAVVRALMDGPVNNDCLPVIPAATKLNACWLANDIAYIDLGSELFLGLAEEADAELFAVYGLVNTIAANISEVKQVQILIDGAPRTTLRGLTRIAQALSPRKDL